MGYVGIFLWLLTQNHVLVPCFYWEFFCRGIPFDDQGNLAVAVLNAHLPTTPWRRGCGLSSGMSRSSGQVCGWSRKFTSKAISRGRVKELLKWNEWATPKLLKDNGTQKSQQEDPQSPRRPEEQTAAGMEEAYLGQDGEVRSWGPWMSIY